MRVVLLAVAVFFISCDWSGASETFDVRAYDCATFRRSRELPALAVLFIDGYVSAQAGLGALDPEWFEEPIQLLAQRCSQAPQAIAAEVWAEIRRELPSPGSGPGAADMRGYACSRLLSREYPDPDWNEIVVPVWLLGYVYAGRADPTVDDAWLGEMMGGNGNPLRRACAAHPEATVLETLRSLMP